ncbi:hypothetical protein ALO87_200021 [Pseudomonas syringae pv. apii]|nr:hypothetical protein ALO87_200021 [Pseudomonas syringae pv. apii]
MTSAHRATTLQPIPAPWFAVKSKCDICNGYRARGNHKACSRERQARYAQSAKESKT